MNISIYSLWASPLAKITTYTSYRIIKFVERLSKKIESNQCVLDVGAGCSPYEGYFSHCEYVSQDVCDKNAQFNYAHIDIKSEIYRIPVKKESFDYILCTQVLEHLKHPHKAFREMHRLLKPRGQLWVTCPLTWEMHDIPYDYFRYTQYALQMLGEDNGFKVESIRPQGGRFIAFGKMLKDLVPGITTHKILYAVLFIVQLPIVLPVLVLLYFLDKLDKNKHLTLNYEAIYEKV